MKKGNKTAENKGYRCSKRVRMRENEAERAGREENRGGGREKEGKGVRLGDLNQFQIQNLRVEFITVRRPHIPSVFLSSHSCFFLSYLHKSQRLCSHISGIGHWDREKIKIEKAMHDKLHDKVLIMVLKSSLYVIRSVT